MHQRTMKHIRYKDKHDRVTCFWVELDREGNVFHGFKLNVGKQEAEGEAGALGLWSSTQG